MFNEMMVAGGGGGSSSLNPTLLHKACLGNNQTSTCSIDKTKKYVVYNYMVYQDTTNLRSQFTYVEDGAVKTVIEPTTGPLGEVTVNSAQDTLTLKGTYPSYYIWFAVYQLD